MGWLDDTNKKYGVTSTQNNQPSQSSGQSGWLQQVQSGQYKPQQPKPTSTPKPVVKKPPAQENVFQKAQQGVTNFAQTLQKNIQNLFQKPKVESPIPNPLKDTGFKQTTTPRSQSQTATVNEIISGFSDLFKGIVPNMGQVAPAKEYFSKTEYNKAVKSGKQQTLGKTVNQILGQQVAFAPSVFVGGWLVDPVTEQIASRIPNGVNILTNILSIAAKGGVKAAPYGLLGATLPAKDIQQRLLNTAEGVASTAVIGMALSGIGSVAGELVNKFGQETTDQFLANRQLIYNVITGKGTPEEVKQFNILNEAGLAREAATGEISVTLQGPKQGKVWDMLRFMFSNHFEKPIPQEQPKETPQPSQLKEGPKLDIQGLDSVTNEKIQKLNIQDSYNPVAEGKIRVYQAVPPLNNTPYVFKTPEDLANYQNNRTDPSQKFQYIDVTPDQLQAVEGKEGVFTIGSTGSSTPSPVSPEVTTKLVEATQGEKSTIIAPSTSQEVSATKPSVEKTPLAPQSKEVRQFTEKYTKVIENSITHFETEQAASENLNGVLNEEIESAKTQPQLQGLKTAINKELRRISEQSGNFKLDYKVLKTLENDTNSGMSQYIKTLMDNMRKISDVMQSQEAQTGSINPAELAKIVTEPIKSVKDYVEKTSEVVKYSGNIENDLYKIKNQSATDKLRAVKVLKSKASQISVTDKEAIINYADNPHGEKLTPEQQKVYDTLIKPIIDDNTAKYTLIKQKEYPIAKEDHITRFVKGKANPIQRLISGRQSIQQGSLLGKTAPFMKKRVMKSLVFAGEGQAPLVTRRVVAVKDEKIIGFQNKKPITLGTLNLKTNEEIMKSEQAPIDKQMKGLESELNAQIRIKETIPSEVENAQKKIDALQTQLKALNDKKQAIANKYNPNILNNKYFVDKQGLKWKIKDATIKEIERETNLQYYKEPLAQVLLTNLKLNEIYRAAQFLDSVKNSPEFQKWSVPIDSVDVPKGYKMTDMPQFKSYLLDPRLADTLDVFYNGMKSGGTDLLGSLKGINRMLTFTITLNPLIHNLNMLDHWLVARGIFKFINPLDYKTLVTTGSRAINAVIHQNEDYLTMMDHGASLLYARDQIGDIHNMFLDKIETDLKNKTGTPVYNAISKALGFSNPLEWMHTLRQTTSASVWFMNDVMTMQMVYEDMSHGLTMEQAINEVGKHFPNYRIPTRMLGSKKLADIYRNPIITAFGSYTSGRIMSYPRMVNELFSLKSTTKQKAHILSMIGMLGFLGLAVYPYLTKLSQKLTNNPRARFPSRGASTLPDAIARFMAGQLDLTQLILGVMIPAPGSELALENIFNVNFFTRQMMYDTSLLRQDPQQFFTNLAQSSLSSLSQSANLQKQVQGISSPSSFIQTELGISNPKSTQAEFDMQDLIYNQKSIVTNKMKAAKAKGDTATENQLMQEFNKRLLQSTKDAYTQEGQKVPSDAVIQRRLKQYWIKPPKNKAMRTYMKNKGKSFIQKITGQ